MSFFMSKNMIRLNKIKWVNKMAKKRKKKNLKNLIGLFLLVLLALGGYCYYQKYKETQNLLFWENERKKEEDERIKKEQQEKEYQKCLTKTFTEEELTESLKTEANEITKYITKNNYQVSVLFEDLTTHYQYSYQPSKVYYGCSLIKIVDALYLINKAIAGEIDLDKETVTYLAKYKVGYSSGMAKRTIGEKVTLRDLITYAITVSDNTAHLMLIDYIGFSNLKAYGESLGAKVILTGGDNFGNQTAEDTTIYLKEAYKIITENEEYGPFLKSIMDNNVRNAYNTDTIKIYHKYGSYANYYHDIGLSLEQRPYAISILTLHENSGYKQIIQSIHEKIRTLQTNFYKNRETVCHNEIYGT